MFKRIRLSSFLILAFSATAAAYYFADWLQSEWTIYRGRQAFQSSKFEAAVEHLTPVVSKTASFSIACWDRPDCATYLRRQLAQSHLALGQDDAALSHYQQLTDSTARFAQGLTALRNGKWEESVVHFKSASQSEGECEICRDALKNAENALAASVSSSKAKQAQSSSLTDMLGPTKCLAFVGGITLVSTGASTVINPQLIAVIRKAGAAKRVAEEAINHLMQALSPAISALVGTVTGDVCPPLREHEMIKRVRENESVKLILDWSEFVPFSGDVHRAAIAAIQTVALAGLVYDYGQALNAELDSNQQAKVTDKRRAELWNALVEASKQPAFLHSGLVSLTAPVASGAPGWFKKTMDAINPAKWFLK